MEPKPPRHGPRQSWGVRKMITLKSYKKIVRILVDTSFIVIIFSSLIALSISVVDNTLRLNWGFSWKDTFGILFFFVSFTFVYGVTKVVLRLVGFAKDSST